MSALDPRATESIRVVIALDLIQDVPQMAEEIVRRQLPAGDWKLVATVPVGLRWDGEPDYSSPLYDAEFGDWETEDGSPVYRGPRKWKHTQESRTYQRVA